ncbi:hypothetical protein J23TS9_08820 [Paenibacillus sp. J23TS9]|nr:hypothetical protein J23TS9_08820 [Paenibacillus sp. J23TS9]
MLGYPLYNGRFLTGYDEQKMQIRIRIGVGYRMIETECIRGIGYGSDQQNFGIG